MADSEGLGRRERKKAQTRARIYQAALELMRERDFDGVTVDDICEAADVAKRTFFLHFPSKDDLLTEYSVQIAREVELLLAETTGDVEARLRAVLGLLVERALGNAEIVRMSVREAWTRAGSAARSMDEGRSLAVQVSGIIASAQRAGEIRPSLDPMLVAGTLIATYFTLVAEWARFGAPDLNVCVDQLIDLTLHGALTRELV